MWEGVGAEVHALTQHDGVGDADAELVAAAHEGRAGGCACGADLEVCEAGGLLVKLVDVWGFEDGVS